MGNTQTAHEVPPVYEHKARPQDTRRNEQAHAFHSPNYSRNQNPFREERRSGAFTQISDATRRNHNIPNSTTVSSSLKSERPTPPKKVTPIPPSPFKPPKKIESHAEFSRYWFCWKEEFHTFITGAEEIKNNKSIWVKCLLNLMGPVGLDMYRTFCFYNEYDKQDIDEILSRFDCYCVFGDIKKQEHEDCSKYIEKLMDMAQEKQKICRSLNVEELIKKKIMQEIDIEQFARAAFEVTKQYCPNLISLSLKQVGTIWMMYENPGMIVVDCKNCGRTHDVDKCPASEKQCKRCKEVGHFIDKCTSNFVFDCDFCGQNHRKGRCPAYGLVCTVCNQKNHYEAKCTGNKPKMNIKCRFCGCNHIASRVECPASNHKCTTCYTIGHFPSQCKNN